MNILIIGASGNLGSHLSKHLLSGPHRLRLLTHTRGLPFRLPDGANAEIIQADLNDPRVRFTAMQHSGCVVAASLVHYRELWKGRSTDL